MRELKIGTGSVRGVVGDGLTPELIVRFSTAFGSWSEGGPVAICRDTRRSSSMFRSAVIAGLLGPGCEILDIGISTTPLLSFTVRELGLAGGIMISGSHNDWSWNALKFIGPDGCLLNSVRSEELFDIYHAGHFINASPEAPGVIDSVPHIHDRYIEHLLSVLDTRIIRDRRFRLAVDFCNGATVGLTSEFLDSLGIVLIPLNSDPTGVFAHSPAPTIQGMRELGKFVQQTKADMGVAINVDGDRVGLVSEKGEPLSEEFTLPLAAKARLQRRAGCIVTTYSTSRMTSYLAANHNQVVHLTNVGESFVMDKGLESGAVIAGEGSGGVGILPISMTFDALLTLGLILEMLARDGHPLSAEAESLPRFHMRKGEVRCEPARGYRVQEQFRLAYPEYDPKCSDGVRVDWDDAWLHVRVSNTEPILRAIVEADTQRRASALFEEAMNLAHSSSLEGERD